MLIQMAAKHASLKLMFFTGFLLIQETVNGQEENAAFQHTATQSSMYGTWYSENAVDGVRDSCSHTNTQTDPWWRVDLMKVYRVNRVAITNRQSSYSEIASRINGAVIRVGNIPDIYSNPICAVVSTIPSGATASFSCGGIEGRYVTVHIPGNGKVLTLCEVEVYGYLGDGAATQSSTFGNWFSEKAIDGNRGLLQLYTGCSSTLNETNPWWRVDLRYIYRVSEVVVTNRKDCCAEQINGVEIRIGNSLESNGNNNPICAVIPAIPAGESYSYSCAGMDGRYVNLIIPGDMKMLTLCEVEVYGEGPVLKRSFVKMQFNSRVGSALAARGFTNVTLRWSQTPKREVKRKYSGNQHCL
uniref:Fucolectin tachylectin-4 pentraxin-1 domain-containing protein n=1 Tax=Sinocyclocheilus grahami TaxID=75366 RepID=A0A672RE99_SINGR